jgi:hypothetical protein
MAGTDKQNENRIIAILESMPFEEARKKILHRELGDQFGSENHNFCLSWLFEKESVRKDEREEETLSISRKALDNSRLATRIAISAIILSIIMATYEIIKWYSK